MKRPPTKATRKEFLVDTNSAAQAVEALISEYGNLVFHTIYGMTGDWEESQDLTQDTFHQALKAIDAARAKSGAQFHAKAWLLRIALNTVRMQHRRRGLFQFIPFSRMSKREHQGKADETDFDTLTANAAPVQPAGYGAQVSANPEALIAERDAVQRTMARLTETLRECLLLSIIGNFSIAEIAEMLEIEEATVRQRLFRARKQFQQFYTHESGEEIAVDTVPTASVEKAPGTDTHQNLVKRVESRAMNSRPQHVERNYAEQLYREPAVSPLW